MVKVTDKTKGARPKAGRLFYLTVIFPSKNYFTYNGKTRKEAFEKHLKRTTSKDAIIKMEWIYVDYAVKREPNKK